MPIDPEYGKRLADDLLRSCDAMTAHRAPSGSAPRAEWDQFEDSLRRGRPERQFGPAIPLGDPVRGVYRMQGHGGDERAEVVVVLWRGRTAIYYWWLPGLSGPDDECAVEIHDAAVS